MSHVRFNDIPLPQATWKRAEPSPPLTPPLLAEPAKELSEKPNKESSAKPTKEFTIFPESVNVQGWLKRWVEMQAQSSQAIDAMQEKHEAQWASLSRFELRRKAEFAKMRIEAKVAMERNSIDDQTKYKEMVLEGRGLLQRQFREMAKDKHRERVLKEASMLQELMKMMPGAAGAPETQMGKACCQTKANTPPGSPTFSTGTIPSRSIPQNIPIVLEHIEYASSSHPGASQQNCSSPSTSNSEELDWESDWYKDMVCSKNIVLQICDNEYEEVEGNSYYIVNCPKACSFFSKDMLNVTLERFLGHLEDEHPRYDGTPWTVYDAIIESCDLILDGDDEWFWSNRATAEEKERHDSLGGHSSAPSSTEYRHDEPSLLKHDVGNQDVVLWQTQSSHYSLHSAGDNHGGDAFYLVLCRNPSCSLFNNGTPNITMEHYMRHLDLEHPRKNGKKWTESDALIEGCSLILDGDYEWFINERLNLDHICSLFNKGTPNITMKHYISHLDSEHPKSDGTNWTEVDALTEGCSLMTEILDGDYEWDVNERLNLDHISTQSKGKRKGKEKEHEIQNEEACVRQGQLGRMNAETLQSKPRDSALAHETSTPATGSNALATGDQRFPKQGVSWSTAQGHKYVATSIKDGYQVWEREINTNAQKRPRETEVDSGYGPPEIDASPPNKKLKMVESACHDAAMELYTAADKKRIGEALGRIKVFFKNITKNIDAPGEQRKEKLAEAKPLIEEGERILSQISRAIGGQSSQFPSALSLSADDQGTGLGGNQNEAKAIPTSKPRNKVFLKFDQEAVASVIKQTNIKVGLDQILFARHEVADTIQRNEPSTGMKSILAARWRERNDHPCWSSK